MDAHEALNIFITARRTVFPHASLPEHKADFRLRYDQEVHRERAANAAANEFTQRFLAGTVPNLPPINQLSSMNIKEARRLFIDARAIAVPTATLLDHQGAFRVQLEDQVRRNNEAAAAAVRRNNKAAAALRARAREFAAHFYGPDARANDFAKRVLAGTVPNLPPMSNLIHTRYEDAIHIFVRARSFALPDASQQDHVNSFDALRAEQLRRNQLTDLDVTRRAQETSRQMTALSSAGGGALEGVLDFNSAATAPAARGGRPRGGTRGRGRGRGRSRGRGGYGGGGGP
ncbi:MAG: hypothetical protein Q9177_003378 [Variospora cf. flavescens]